MPNYDLAIVCGRFQPLHNGHVMIIQKALDMAEHVGLYIGSCNNTGTPQNPLNYVERLNLIYKVFGKEITSGKLIVKALFDRENPADDQSWGKYYLDHIHKDFGNPDLFVYGNDKVRQQWFTEEDLIGIDELVINRTTNPITATSVREHIDDMQWFCKNTPKQIWEDYDKIKEKIKGVTK